MLMQAPFTQTPRFSEHSLTSGRETEALKPQVSREPETSPCALRMDPAIAESPSPDLGAEPLVGSQ